MAYPGYAYSATHPAHLEVIGALFGLETVAAAGSRVLELGCGDATNLLSIAQTLPGAVCVGVDASAGAIERGRRLARAAGLTNVTLRVASLEALPEDLGEFDYIVSHGVFSWVTPAAREALLRCCSERLRPGGVAYVSYNAYPGCHLRDMTREILRYHVRDLADPDARLRRAQELMRTIVAIDEPSPFARALREQMQRMLSYSDALLFHDDLAEISTPFYFHEFAAAAAAAGLQFLAEAELSESRMDGVPASAAELASSIADDPLAREQYIDFFKNRSFRRTLLCHADVAVERAISDIHVERFAISSAGTLTPGEQPGEERTFSTPEGDLVTTSQPWVLAALAALSEAWPQAISFAELAARTLQAGEAPGEVADARLRAFLLEAYTARVVRLHSVAPPLASRASERPCASALARAQCAAGMPVVSSLLHVNAHLEGELEPRLLPLLDGTRDREQLHDGLAPWGAEAVDAALARLASIGLLEASAPAGIRRRRSQSTGQAERLVHSI